VGRRSPSQASGRQHPSLLEGFGRQLLEAHPIVHVAHEQMQRRLVGVGCDPREEFPARLLVKFFPEEAGPQQHDSIRRKACKRVRMEQGKSRLDAGCLGQGQEFELGALHRLAIGLQLPCIGYPVVKGGRGLGIVERLTWQMGLFPQCALWSTHRDTVAQAVGARPLEGHRPRQELGLPRRQNDRMERIPNGEGPIGWRLSLSEEKLCDTADESPDVLPAALSGWSPNAERGIG